MQSSKEKPRSHLGKWILCGGLAGMLVGLVGGPVVVFVAIVISNNFYGGTSNAMELLFAPLFGVIVAVPEGLTLGLLWGIKSRRLTLGWLMVVVPGLGLLLSFFASSTLLGLMALTLLLMVAVLTKAIGRLVDGFRADAEARRKRRRMKPVPQSTAWLYERVSRWEDSEATSAGDGVDSKPEQV